MSVGHPKSSLVGKQFFLPVLCLLQFGLGFSQRVQANDLGRPRHQPFSLRDEVIRLIGSGELSEAEEILDVVSDDDPNAEYLRGIVAYKRESYEDAISHFQTVRALTPKNPTICLNLALSYTHTNRLGQAYDTLNSCRSEWDSAAHLRLKAQLELRRGDWETALSTLAQGLTLFPTSEPLLKDQMLALAELGFYNTAFEKALHYLDQYPQKRDVFLFVAGITARLNRPEKTVQVLERANLIFSEDTEILAQLGMAYVRWRRYPTAARYLELASRLGYADAAFAAAECYRRAKKYRKALQLNAGVTDKKKQLSQRLAIYLNQKRYTRVIALKRQLQNAGALDDTNRHRLIFALIQTGDILEARRQIENLNDLQLKTDLLREIEKGE